MRDSARSVHDGFIHTSNYGTGTMDPSTTVAPTAFDNPGSNHFDPGGPNSCFVPGGAHSQNGTLSITSSYTKSIWAYLEDSLTSS